MAQPTLVIGEALIDIVHRTGRPPVEHVGGSPANVAIGLSRLGHPVELATHIATDPHGRMIADLLAAEGVPLTPGSDTATRTPTATALLDDQGVAAYEFDLEWQMPPVPTEVTHLHTGSIAATLEPGASAVLAAVEDARPRATISFDPNLRPTLMGSAHDVRAKVEQLIGLCDVVKASEEDVEWLYDGTPVAEILRLWSRLGPGLIVITRGGEGAVVTLPGTSEATSVDAKVVDVVDTVGAGDSFMSGLVSGLLDASLLGGRSARERMRESNLPDIRPAVARAVAASAVTVSRAGANPPTRAELL
ncbi:PfkB family carbohydrate kinase [Segeticoccus rhizosphaerae]|jgi:fructokinase|uniref:PfkB family carbohydrate kinase n=1 Tax=Segeticoccus rhizosphaerae TaxID=1104777 RepID=UPI0010C15620|nr:MULTISPECIES: PfkB family carbohydrate kinase [Intrasporangiaceae]